MSELRAETIRRLLRAPEAAAEENAWLDWDEARRRGAPKEQLIDLAIAYLNLAIANQDQEDLDELD